MGKNINIEVYNDNEKVYQGDLNNWLSAQCEEDKEELYNYCIPLINKEKNSITFVNFHSGIWIVKRI